VTVAESWESALARGRRELAVTHLTIAEHRRSLECLSDVGNLEARAAHKSALVRLELQSERLANTLIRLDAEARRDAQARERSR
jgi:hypothetical protein